MQKCKECGHSLLTATSQCDTFRPDSEPYESGVIQETEYDSIDEYVAVGILWCPEHGIQHIWIEEPRVAKAGINVYKTILNTVVEPIATQDEERLRDLHKWVAWLKKAKDKEPRMLGETLERALRYVSTTIA